MSKSSARTSEDVAQLRGAEKIDESLRPLLKESAALHRHLCPRQVLGVRMGLLAGKLLDLPLPQGDDKRVFVFMETDGCGADGVSVASGCWVGRRTMRIVDFGKLAATFVDRNEGRAYRIRPHLQSRVRAREVKPDAPSRWQAMLEAYQIIPDEELLEWTPVRLTVDLKALISEPGIRAECEECGEEIINAREVEQGGRTLCRGCAGQAYYEPLT